MTIIDQREIPHHRMSCPVPKLGRVTNVGLRRGVWHQSAFGEQLHCARLAFFHFLLSLLHYFTLFSIIVFNLNIQILIQLSFPLLQIVQLSGRSLGSILNYLSDLKEDLNH